MNFLNCTEGFESNSLRLASIKDNIYTKLPLMPWMEGPSYHNLSGLTEIGNIIANLFLVYLQNSFLRFLGSLLEGMVGFPSLFECLRTMLWY